MGKWCSLHINANIIVIVFIKNILYYNVLNILIITIVFKNNKNS